MPLGLNLPSLSVGRAGPAVALRFTLELKRGRWVVYAKGLSSHAIERALIPAVERWIEQHHDRYIELGQRGIEKMGRRLTGRDHGSVWSIGIGGDRWTEILDFLGDVVSTLRVTGGKLQGVDLATYEDALGLVTRTSSALANLDALTRPAKRRAAA